MGAIPFATSLLIFMLSRQLGSYDTMIDSAIKTYSGPLQVQAKGYKEKRDIRQVVSDSHRLEALLKDLPEVKAYTFRGNAFSLLSSRART